jgi:hypothetical protein
VNGRAAEEPRRTSTSTHRTAIDEQAWEREMNRLRRISVLLSVVLAAVVARMVIDGPRLLGDLTGALIAVLLLCALALRRRGARVRPGASSGAPRQVSD